MRKHQNICREGFWYYILSVFIIGFIFFSYSFGSNITDSINALGWIYLATSCLTHAAILMIPLFLIAYLIVYLPLSSLSASRKIAKSVLALLYGLMLIAAVANGFVYRIYHFHINGFIIEMITSAGASEIFVFGWWLYLKAFAFAIALFGLSFGLWWVAGKLNSTIHIKHLYRKGIGFFVLLALLSQGISIYGGATMNTAIYESNGLIPYYFPLRMNSLLTKMGIIDKKKVNMLTFKGGTDAVKYPLKPVVRDLQKPKMNIVILGIDSWSPRTATPECTPNILRFGKGAEYFARHISSGNDTRSGLFGLFTGLPSYYWNSFEYSNTQPILIDELLKSHYQVQAYPSATMEYPPFAKMFFHHVKGINVNTPGSTTYERDCNITRNFIRFLDQYDGKQPFFSFVFYDLAHAINLPKERQTRFKPCWEEADYLTLSNDTDPKPFFNLYRNCVAEVDSLIGLVIGKMEQKGLLRNTVVIITGDHGQEFNENHNNYWGHSSDFTKYQTDVPLLYYYPGCRPGKRTYRTTHYDITPTLLKQVLGMKNAPSDVSMGKFLWDKSPRDWHFVGNEISYAFILNDGTIVEKKGNGSIKITDQRMKLKRNFRLNAIDINKAITRLNRFYKQHGR